MTTRNLLKMDMLMSIIMSGLVIFSIVSKDFSIFPKVDPRILGMNNFNIILQSISNVFVGIGIILTYISFLFLIDRLLIID